MNSALCGEATIQFIILQDVGADLSTLKWYHEESVCVLLIIMCVVDSCFAFVVVLR